MQWFFLQLLNGFRSKVLNGHVGLSVSVNCIDFRKMR
jgi:hypothetical protein